METQIRTPQMVFLQPQRLIVPLFQRPYVWNQEKQWEPLWNDVVRVADRLRARPHDKPQPHFLGAVVLQQVQGGIGQMQERTIIDGQQRLTTLQLLLDALHNQLHAAGAMNQAMRVESLVVNAKPFCVKPEDGFKVWPTNRDRPAFNAVMGAEPPVNHDALGFSGERMVEAHRFFSLQASQWLSLDGKEGLAPRADAIERVVRDLLQMVVIDLAAEENAQEIFETLNARGSQLTAADLIKNFVFQRLQESGTNVEAAYQQYWKDFETGFWEAEVGAGRVRLHRSSIFLNHWLIARTGEEVLAREVFSRFKAFVNDSKIPMPEILKQIYDAAVVYRQFVTAAAVQSGAIDRLGLFGYRTSVLESEVIKPVVMYLLDPQEPPIPTAQLTKALDVMESWMVRRMLVRESTKNYNQVVAELVSQLRKSDRAVAGDIVEGFLSKQTSESRYWPDDEEVKTELRELLAYRRLGRGRLRMVLEAIEDYLRGWKDGKVGLGGERVARGKYAIEHVMPRKWIAHWPLDEGAGSEADRDSLIHTIGNLTLLTSKLNTKVSNGPWTGASGKREGLEAHDVLVLNRDLIKKAGASWSDDLIRSRTEELTKAVIAIWSVPAGHHSGFSRDKQKPRQKVDLADLISAGLLRPGMSLVPRRKKHASRVATLLPDGGVEVAGISYASPSGAAVSITGRSTNGWWFFLVDPTTRRSLRDVLREYVTALSVDIEDDDAGDGDEEEE